MTQFTSCKANQQTVVRHTNGPVIATYSDDADGDNAYWAFVVWATRNSHTVFNENQNRFDAGDIGDLDNTG